MGAPSDLHAMAILAALGPRLARWPLAARIALRNAVLADPSPFLSGGAIDRGAILIEAQRFLAHWAGGLPWPPVVAAPAPVADAAPPREIDELATLAAAVGLRLALAMRAPA